MKKVCKIILITFIIISVYSAVYTINATNIWQTGNKFLNEGANTITFQLSSLWGAAGDTLAKASFKEIIDFLWGIGLLVVFASTIVLGIKYMLVNPNEKSRIKQATTPYIMGVIIVFGAITIWKLLIDILEGSMLGG